MEDNTDFDLPQQYLSDEAVNNNVRALVEAFSVLKDAIPYPASSPTVYSAGENFNVSIIFTIPSWMLSEEERKYYYTIGKTVTKSFADGVVITGPKANTNIVGTIIDAITKKAQKYVATAHENYIPRLARKIIELTYDHGEVTLAQLQQDFPECESAIKHACKVADDMASKGPFTVRITDTKSNGAPTSKEPF